MSQQPHTWPRLFVKGPLAAAEKISLPLEATHYLLNVLRTRMGDPIRLFNGQDGEWLGFLAESPKNKKTGAILHVESQRIAQRQEPDVWLCPAPIKKNHFDYMIEKATELGVSEIRPLLTARTQVREINKDRIQQIVIESAEQSERLTVPSVCDAVQLKSWIGAAPQDRAIILGAEFGDALPINDALKKIPPHLTKAAILTGPEGGFTVEEMDFLTSLPHVFPVRLGPRILRADTAALAALACWQSVRGDWKKETE